MKPMIPVGLKKPHVYMLNGEWYSISYSGKRPYRIGPCRTIKELKK